MGRQDVKGAGPTARQSCLRSGSAKGTVSGAFAVAGAGFEQTSTTAYRFVEIRPLH